LFRRENARWGLLPCSTAGPARGPTAPGLGPSQIRDAHNESADGYAWHLSLLRCGERTYCEYEANGNGGQLLIVVPALELTVVFTAGNYEQSGIWGQFRDQIVPREIIPALRR
jgi:hypothetical protein